jgi:hypothetical protein
MRTLTILFTLIIVALNGIAQDITGDWYLYKIIELPPAGSSTKYGETLTDEQLGSNEWLLIDEEKLTIQSWVMDEKMPEYTFDYTVENSTIFFKSTTGNIIYGEIVEQTKDYLIIFREKEGWDFYRSRIAQFLSD